MSVSEHKKEEPALWGEDAPRQFDLGVAWWVKAGLVLGMMVVAMFWLDGPVAKWAIESKPLEAKWIGGDIRRELRMLEQYGQWTCSVVVIAAVGLIDRQGRRRALAIGIGCLVTVLLTYLLKDCFGRARPWTAQGDPWMWGGPMIGFKEGSAWGSFPSAHTTGAFALSVGLSWFYPRARGVFMGLAVMTATLRVLNGAHWVSDTLAGLLMSVVVTRWTLGAKVAGRVLAVMPGGVRGWFELKNGR